LGTAAARILSSQDGRAPPDGMEYLGGGDTGGGSYPRSLRAGLRPGAAVARPRRRPAPQPVVAQPYNSAGTRTDEGAGPGSAAHVRTRIARAARPTARAGSTGCPAATDLRTR